MSVLTRTSGSGARRRLAACACVLLGTLAIAGTPALAQQSDCANANRRTNARNTAVIARATLCLVDRIRSAHGLAPLRADRTLAAVARGVAAGLVHENYFADSSPVGGGALGLVSASGYAQGAPQITVGQNLAWGTAAHTTPTRIVAAWMASPPHRRNILDSLYRDAGVAVAPAIPRVLHVGRTGATYAFIFAARLN